MRTVELSPPMSKYQCIKSAYPCKIGNVLSGKELVQLKPFKLVASLKSKTITKIIIGCKRNEDTFNSQDQNAVVKAIAYQHLNAHL